MGDYSRSRYLLLVALAFSSAMAFSPLKQNLKTRDISNTLETGTNGVPIEEILARDNSISGAQNNAGNELEQDFIFYKTPFTAGPYYDFLRSFLQGLNPEIYWDSSVECIDNFVYIVDDFTYLSNNFTYRDHWEDPILNFTALIAGNFSDSVLNCYLFGMDFWYEQTTSY